MDAALAINVMGQFTIRLHGEIQPIKAMPRRKVRSLLKLLALEPTHALSRDVLIELLWSDLDPTAAAAQLYNALYNLRKALGDFIAPKLVSGMVRLEPQGGLRVDATDFMALAREGLSQKDVVQLSKAANFIDGQPMTEDMYEGWAESYRQELLDLQTQVLTTLANLDTSQAEVAWKKYLHLEPTSQEAHLGLIRHYAATGLNGLATEQFERYRQMLSEELGIEPSSEAKEIISHLAQPTPSQTKTVRQPLPAPTVPLVGRETELETLHGFFVDTDWRLLTILGIGGNGKTRLALEAAWTWQHMFADGAYWVSLENISSLDDPSQSVLLALGLTPPNSQAETMLFDYLQAKECLLVLDNLEHLPEIGHWIQRLLTGAGKLKILATSRSVLQLHGERVLELSGLHAEDAKTLFVQSATRVKPGFFLDAKIEQQIGVLTEHLAGSPLAIELAASWIRHMGLEEIAAEVQLDLDFLERPVKDRHARHHSVRAVFDSSWRLLEETEQHTLVSLAVFVGEFTLASARAVSGASRAAIVALTDRSLLRLTDTRLELHPLLRQFVLEQAQKNPSQLQTMRQAHAEHYFEQICLLPNQIATTDTTTFLEIKRKCELIYFNARAAWQWALELNPDAVLESANGFFVLHQVTNRLFDMLAVLPKQHQHANLLLYLRSIVLTTFGQFKEGEEALNSLDSSQLSLEQQSYHLRQLSTIYSRTGRGQEALQAAQQAVQVALAQPYKLEQSYAYMQLCDALAMLGRLGEAKEAARIAQANANVRVRSFLHIVLATLAGRAGELEHAEQELRSAQQQLLQLDDLRNLQVVQNNLATALQLQGKYLESLEILEQSANAARKLGDQRILAVIQNSRMVSLCALGKYQEALQVAHENLKLCERTGNTLRVAQCLSRTGHIYFDLGHYPQALEQYQMALRLEVAEAKEDSLIGLIRAHLALGQTKEAKLHLQTDLKLKVFTAWRAVFLVKLNPKPTRQDMQETLAGLLGVSVLNACEGLAYLLETLHALEPAFAQRLANSLIQDPRSSHYSRQMAQAFAGTSNQQELPWKELISSW